MDSRGSKLSLDEQSEILSGLHCPICLGIFNTPVSLSCGHSFCSGCVRDVVLSPANSNYSCPECRQINSVYPLPINYPIQRALDSLRCSKPSCNQTVLNANMQFCKHCNKRFCDSCLEIHVLDLLADIEMRLDAIKTGLAEASNIDVDMVASVYKRSLEHFENELDAASAKIIESIETSRENYLKEAKKLVASKLLKLNHLQPSDIQSFIANTSGLIASAAKNGPLAVVKDVFDVSKRIGDIETVVTEARAAGEMDKQIKLVVNKDSLMAKLKQLLDTGFQIVEVSAPVVLSQRFLGSFNENKDYPQNFGTNLGKAVFEGSLDIQAILVAHDRASMICNELPHILVVQKTCEVVALSGHNWNVVQWRSKILPPENYDVSSGFEILDAAYDPETDDIYFNLLVGSALLNVYRINRLKLQQGPVNASVFIEDATQATNVDVVGGAMIASVSIECQQRLLFVSGESVAFSIWHLSSSGIPQLLQRLGEEMLYQLCRFVPSYCQPFATENKSLLPAGVCQIMFPDDEIEADKLLLLALNHQLYNRLAIVAVRLKMNEADDSPDLSEFHLIADTEVMEITDARDVIGRMGTMLWDPAGGLMMADMATNRVHAFSLSGCEKTNNRIVPRKVWQSNDIGKDPFRVAIAVNPGTGKPTLLVSDVQEYWVATFSEENSSFNYSRSSIIEP